MSTIKITTDDGEEHTIAVAGQLSDIDGLVESRGYDLDTVVIEGPQKYIVRRITQTDYRVEDPNGNVLVSTTYETPPDIPEGIAEDIVTFAEDSDSAAMHELRKMMLVGFRYVDDR